MKWPSPRGPRPPAASRPPGKAAGYQASLVPAAPRPPLPQEEWEEHVDSASGKAFYYNTVTKESAWAKPAPTPATASASAPAPAAKSSDWAEHRDPATGKTYYFNAVTKETRWERPLSLPASSSASAPAARPDPWTEHTDPATGKSYYYNALTRETSWTKPPEPTLPKARTPVPPTALPAKDDWEEHRDPATGNSFYYNATTQETSWTEPPAKPAIAAAPKAPPVPPARNEWEEHLDAASGKAFYYNTVTRESTWTKPAPKSANASLSAAAAPASSSASATVPASRGDPWTEHVDPATGQCFYYNASTKATAWMKPPATNPKAPPAAPAPPARDDWKEHQDPATGKPFYYNAVTKETTWSKPAPTPTVPIAVPKAPKAPLPPPPPQDAWEEHRDSASGKVFYYNTVTKETTWTRPPSATPSGSTESLRLLAFDFDCTIAAIHVFEDLYKKGGFDSTSQRARLDVQCRQDADYPSRIFGGEERQRELQGFFQRLQRPPERKLVIISTGYGAVIEDALTRGSLREYFVEVIGREHPLSTANAGKKDRILEELQRRDGVTAWQTLFVDDDPNNVLPAAERRVCRTAWVPTPHGGMDGVMLRRIREAAEDDSGVQSRSMFCEDMSLQAVPPSPAAGARSLRATVDAVKRASRGRW